MSNKCHLWLFCLESGAVFVKTFSMKKKEKKMQIYFWVANVDLYHHSQLTFYWYLKFYDCEGLYSFGDIDNDQTKYYAFVNSILSSKCGSKNCLILHQ